MRDALEEVDVFHLLLMKRKGMIAGASAYLMNQRRIEPKKIRECSAGSGFQISLKDRCAMVVVEANGRHNSPGSILGSMGRAALIVGS